MPGRAHNHTKTELLPKVLPKMFYLVQFNHIKCLVPNCPLPNCPVPNCPTIDFKCNCNLQFFDINIIVKSNRQTNSIANILHNTLFAFAIFSWPPNPMQFRYSLRGTAKKIFFVNYEPLIVGSLLLYHFFSCPGQLNR